MGDNAMILDTRTPGEYKLGHLHGAVLLDWNSGEFAARVGELDPDATYKLYCRTGNRSGQAAHLMEQRGFKSATNLGSLEEASVKTGIEIVTD